MSIVTTTEAEKTGLVIEQPLIIVDTADGPYLSMPGYKITAPEALAKGPALAQQELTRWAASRGYFRMPGTHTYFTRR